MKSQLQRAIFFACIFSLSCLQRVHAGGDESLVGYFNGSVYTLHLESVDYITAEKRCKDEGSSIASLKNDKENDYLVGMIQKADVETGSVWLGLVGFFGDFEWIDSSGSGYQHWAMGHPRKLDDQTQKCTGLVYNPAFSLMGEWSEFPCDKAMMFACKAPAPKEASQTPEEIEEEIADLAAAEMEGEQGAVEMGETSEQKAEAEKKIGQDLEKEGVAKQAENEANPQFSLNGKVYNLHRELKTYLDAIKVCSDADQSLLSIYSEEENSFVSEVIKANKVSTARLWIGYDRCDRDDWTWLAEGEEQQEEEQYNSWLPRQPSNYKGEDCAEYLYNVWGKVGKWSACTCTARKMFICTGSTLPPKSRSPVPAKKTGINLPPLPSEGELTPNIATADLEPPKKADVPHSYSRPKIRPPTTVSEETSSSSSSSAPPPPADDDKPSTASRSAPRSRPATSAAKIWNDPNRGVAPPAEDAAPEAWSPPGAQGAGPAAVPSLQSSDEEEEEEGEDYASDDDEPFRLEPMSLGDSTVQFEMRNVKLEGDAYRRSGNIILTEDEGGEFGAVFLGPGPVFQLGFMTSAVNVSFTAQMLEGEPRYMEEEEGTCDNGWGMSIQFGPRVACLKKHGFEGCDDQGYYLIADPGYQDPKADIKLHPGVYYQNAQEDGLQGGGDGSWFVGDAHKVSVLFDPIPEDQNERAAFEMDDSYDMESADSTGMHQSGVKMQLVVDGEHAGRPVIIPADLATGTEKLVLAALTSPSCRGKTLVRDMTVSTNKILSRKEVDLLKIYLEYLDVQEEEDTVGFIQAVKELFMPTNLMVLPATKTHHGFLGRFSLAVAAMLIAFVVVGGLTLTIRRRIRIHASAREYLPLNSPTLKPLVPRKPTVYSNF